MASKPHITAQQLAHAKEKLYHHVACDHLSGLRISLTDEGRQHKPALAIIGISSKETIRKGLQAVDASPFKTVFIVDEASGKVLYALSKNEDYVAKAKKKKKNPPPPPPPPPTPTSECCQLCAAKGGYACDPLPDGSCICYGATHETGGGGLDDELGTLAP